MRAWGLGGAGEHTPPDWGASRLGSRGITGNHSEGQEPGAPPRGSSCLRKLIFQGRKRNSCRQGN